jgi:hypothetical protein
MLTRNHVVNALWIFSLAPLCTCCGPSSHANGAQGTVREPRRGSVFGVVFQPQEIYEGGKFRLDPNRGPWAFADGEVVSADHCSRSDPNVPNYFKPIKFKTDAHGRFRVDNVPVGTVAVNLHDRGGDIVSAFSRIGYVLDGKSTEVRFFEPSDPWNTTWQYVIGDGSPAQFLSGTGMGAKRKVANVTTNQPMFRIDLEPKEDEPVSFCEPAWHNLDDRQQILLRDVHPGKYHAVVGDFLGTIAFRGNLIERDVEVKPGHAAFTVRLGAGCIAGAVQWSKQFRYMVHVIAIGKKSHASHHARCDNEGNFCVRYLDPDDYLLFAHDYDAGWCRIGEAAVTNTISDVGSHRLLPGGTITSRLPASAVGNASVTVTATDLQGFAIDWPGPNAPVSPKFTISGQWPGKWTLTLRKCKKRLAVKTSVLRGTETISCDFD